MMSARRPLIAGNWKMSHGGTSGVELAGAIVKSAREFTSVDLVIAPPFTVLAACAHEVDGSGVAVAAQNFFPKDSGAFTGEISAPMLRDSGCTYVIVGHSERRQLFGETNDSVADKTAAALNANLVPIVCVGETLAEREAGKTLDVVTHQVNAFLGAIAAHAMPVAIAYEPVWAIGTGKVAGPAEAEEVHEHIRRMLVDDKSGKHPGLAARTRILYGGSVKPDNASGLLACPNVDGALVGGASLDAASFGAIARAAQALASK
jgi:triosephosphate isomerase